MKNDVLQLESKEKFCHAAGQLSTSNACKLCYLALWENTFFSPIACHPAVKFSFEDLKYSFLEISTIVFHKF